MYEVQRMIQLSWDDRKMRLVHCDKHIDGEGEKECETLCPCMSLRQKTCKDRQQALDTGLSSSKIRILQQGNVQYDRVWRKKPTHSWLDSRLLTLTLLTSDELRCCTLFNDPLQWPFWLDLRLLTHDFWPFWLDLQLMTVVSRVTPHERLELRLQKVDLRLAKVVSRVTFNESGHIPSNCEIPNSSYNWTMSTYELCKL